MKKNRQPEVPVDDYTISNAINIKFHGLNLSIMPRYKEHFISKKYEAFSIAITKNYLKPDMNAIDIGAHMGAFSAIMAEKIVNKTNHLYSYEPVPENRELLKKNLKSNRFSTKDVKPYAISDKDGVAVFNIPWASDSAGLYEHPNAATIRQIDVNLRSLDSLHKNERIDFIKIDTEGNEIKVFHGAKEVFKNNPTLRMLVEFNPECLDSAGEKEPSHFFEVLHGYGFKTLIIDEDNYQFDEVTKPKDWQDAMKGREYANVYCVPNSTEVAIVGFHTAQFGGGELVAYEGCHALREEGMIVNCLVPEDGPMAYKLRNEGFATYVVPFLSWARDSAITDRDLHNEIRKNSEATLEIYRIFDRVRYAVSISHTITQPWLAIASAARRIPHVWDIHEFGNKGVVYKFDYPDSVVFDTISDLSSCVVVHSNVMKNHLMKMGIIAEKIRICPIGIFNKKNSTFKNTYASAAQKYIIVGKITKHKNQLQVARAIRDVNKRGLNTTLTIVGSREEVYTDMIDEFIRANHLQDTIKIIDHTESIRELMVQHDALIMATKYESFGRVTAEAITLGLPVIGSINGGTPEIVRNGTDGLLYDTDSDKSLEDAIFLLSTDTHLYKKLILGTKESSIPSKYSTDIFQKEFLKIIKDSVNAVPQKTYFQDKILSTFSDVKKDDDKKIQQRDEKIDLLNATLDAKHNDLLVANHRIEQLRSRIINKSAFKYWFDKINSTRRNQ